MSVRFPCWAIRVGAVSDPTFRPTTLGSCKTFQPTILQLLENRWVNRSKTVGSTFLQPLGQPLGSDIYFSTDGTVFEPTAGSTVLQALENHWVNSWLLNFTQPRANIYHMLGPRCRLFRPPSQPITTHGIHLLPPRLALAL